MALVMKNYRYSAVNEAGKNVKGDAQGTNKTMVQRFLEMQNMSVVSIEEHNTFLTKLSNITLGASIKRETLLFYIKQLGALLNAGTKIVEALEILASQQKNKNAKRVCFIVYQEVYNGTKLSKAFELFPNDFPPLLIAMTEAGEATGELADVLLRTGEYMENQDKLNGKIKKAITKPLTYLAAAFAVAIGMTLFVFPTFMSMFSEMDAGDLPIFTKIYVELLKFLKCPWGWGTGALILVLVILYMAAYKKNPKFKRAMTKFFLKVPGFGTLIQMNNQIIIASTLAQLMGRGVPATQALEVAKRVTQNDMFVELLEEAHQNVTEGKGFAKSFIESPYIDPIMSRMIETGEKTSEIPKLLKSLTGYFNEVAEVKVAQISKTISPIMMIFVYMVVLSLLLAIMLPQLTMAMNV